MTEFTLYTFTFLSRAERVQWCLDELGLGYELKALDPFKGEIFTPEFTQLNPLRKMPVLVHHRPSEDKVLTESMAILEYLDNYSNAQLKPTTLDERYQYDKAMFFGATELEAYLWVANQSTVLRGIYHWPEHTEKEAIRQVERALPEVFTWLAKRLYIAGNSFTLADIYYYQLLKWAARYHLDLPAHVNRYIDRVAQRPSLPKDFK